MAPTQCRNKPDIETFVSIFFIGNDIHHSLFVHINAYLSYTKYIVLKQFPNMGLKLPFKIPMEDQRAGWLRPSCRSVKIVKYIFTFKAPKVEMKLLTIIS